MSPQYEAALIGWEEFVAAALDVDELAEALRRALDDVADRTEDYARALKNHLLGDENHE